MLYSLTARHARRKGEIPRLEVEGEPRQDVMLESDVRFERACPVHGLILGGLDGFWCPYRKSHNVIPHGQDELDGAAFVTVLLWKLVMVREGHAPQCAAKVYGGRVEWAAWFLNRYPDAVQQVHGRDREGFRPGRLVVGSAGFKQRMFRLRQRGLSAKAARAEAERQALARLAVALERQQGQSERGAA